MSDLDRWPIPGPEESESHGADRLPVADDAVSDRRSDFRSYLEDPE